MLFMSCVCHAFAAVHCCLVVTCWEGAGLLALACDVKLSFCHVPMWYPGSGVVLDCIDSWSLPPFLLCNFETRYMRKRIDCIEWTEKAMVNKFLL